MPLFGLANFLELNDSFRKFYETRTYYSSTVYAKVTSWYKIGLIYDFKIYISNQLFGCCQVKNKNKQEL